MAKKSEIQEEPIKMTFLQKLKKLQDLMDEFSWEKDGINRHQSYKYISEAQYKTNFKKARTEAGLLWKCEALEYQYIPGISDKMHLVLAKFKGQLIDPETGEKEEYYFAGSGADNGDKALYKAYTGGLKFFLSSNYLVAEYNDPENDGEVKAEYTSPEKREEIKEALTQDGKATKLQIESLKKALKALRDADPDQEVFISELVDKTNNFTELTKRQCEQLLVKIGEMIQAKKEGDAVN